MRWLAAVLILITGCHPVVVNANNQVEWGYLTGDVPFEFLANTIFGNRLYGIGRAARTTLLTEVAIAGAGNINALAVDTRAPAGQPTFLVSYDQTVQLGSTAYLASDIIQCYLSCQLLVDTAAELGFKGNIGVDALSVVAEGDLLMSFDSGFLLNGIYIDPRDVVRRSSSSQYSIEYRNSVFPENANLTGIGTLGGQLEFITVDQTYTAGFTNGPTDVFRTSGQRVFSFSSIKPAGINAYATVDSGLITFEPEISLVVNENAGTLSFPVMRTGGSEANLRVAVQVAGGSAQAGVDYNLLTSQLDWANTDTATQSVELEIIDNTIIDSLRGLRLQLVIPPDQVNGWLLLGGFNSIDVFIRNDDVSGGDITFVDGFE